MRSITLRPSSADPLVWSGQAVGASVGGGELACTILDLRRPATRRASCRGMRNNTPQSVPVNIFSGAGDIESSLQIGRRFFGSDATA